MIECSWTDLLAALEEASDLDALIAAHASFLEVSARAAALLAATTVSSILPATP